jgi:hypothetical protein
LGTCSKKSFEPHGACAVAVALLLAGCAASPTVETLTATPVPVRAVDGAPAIRDGRAGFRGIFCSTLRADGLAPAGDESCERWLWRLPDEPVGGDVPVRAMPAPEDLAIFLVTGAFSECVGDEARPLSAGAGRWRALGAHVETIVVSGRSGSDQNARQIADFIAGADLPDSRTVILIGFSKGALDILHYLVNFPEAATRVAAVVSISSPVFGSLLADKASFTYSTFLSRLPYSRCAPGDGQIIRSLTTDAASEWIASNVLPRSVRYYSLAGFTTREHMARGLVTGWKILTRADPRNDGQVIAADAVIPGATLLGYANADHWGVATTIEVTRKFLGARPDPTPFPLESLFDSILKFVTGDLASPGISTPDRLATG